MIVSSACCICAIIAFWNNYQYLVHSSTILYLFLQELLKTLSVDAYVIVFSVNNPSTFQIAKDNLNKIRNELKINKTIILVANKIDLVRKRAVPANGIISFDFKSILFKKNFSLKLLCFIFNYTNTLKCFMNSPLNVTRTKL